MLKKDTKRKPKLTASAGSTTVSVAFLHDDHSTRAETREITRQILKDDATQSGKYPAKDDSENVAGRAALRVTKMMRNKSPMMATE